MAGLKHRDTVAEHKEKAAISVSVAVITLSTSRTRERDKSGDVIQNLLETNGHTVAARIVLPDDRNAVRKAVREAIGNEKVEAIITTGGTGLAAADVTIEAVKDMLDKELPGFNSLFMLLSYQQVKSACMLSRAMAGVIRGKVIFCLPGSPRACELAVEGLILPELGHMLKMLES